MLAKVTELGMVPGSCPLIPQTCQVLQRLPAVPALIALSGWDLSMLRPWPLLARGSCWVPAMRPLPLCQVNDTSFQSLPREDAVQYLLSLPPGEEVILQTQRKQDSK